MRDSALKPSTAGFVLLVLAFVGEELMRDSALKHSRQGRPPFFGDRSEKSSCATAL